MKVIDLLNRIAKDEGIPIKIKFKGKEYEWSQEFYDYRGIDITHSFLVENLETEDLNRTCEEIPIIGDKKIEKIDMFDYFTGYDFDNTSIDLRKHLEVNFQTLNNKINDIIDRINKGDK